jgi:hypothetical protein
MAVEATIPSPPDIDALIAQHLEGSRGGRDHSCFHVTDLNACPRSVFYRMTGQTRDKTSATKVKMFELAHRLHELTYDALDAAGILYEQELPISMPPGWSGTADALCYDLSDFDEKTEAPLIIADVKTSHPNIIRFADSLPRGEDILQVSAYAHMYELHAKPGDRRVRTDYAWLLYEDRGGSNASIPKLVDVLPLRYVQKAMNDLFDAVEPAVRGEQAPPPLLTDKLSYKNKRGPETFEVWSRPDWHCRYCEYHCEGRVNEDEEKGKLLYKRTKTKGIEFTSEGYAFDKEHPGAIDTFIMQGEGDASDDA